MIRRADSGLTLVEVIVTIGLLALIVQVTAALIRDVSKTSENQRIRSGFTAGLIALQRMKEEALEALVIQSPDSPADSEVLEFEKLLQHPDRLPPLPEEWNARDPNHLSRVRYYLQEDSLRRLETRPNAPPEEVEVVQRIDSFIVSRPSDDVLEFRFSFRVGKSLRSFRTRTVRFLP